MRAYDITLFLIILQATIGFVNTLGIFEQDYYATQNNTYTRYQVSDMQDYKDQAENPGVSDYVELLGSFAWHGFWAVLEILFAIVAIMPLLMITFGLTDTSNPEVIALMALLQVGIYVIYYMGYAQWRANKRLGDYQ